MHFRGKITFLSQSSCENKKRYCWSINVQTTTAHNTGPHTYFANYFKAITRGPVPLPPGMSAVSHSMSNFLIGINTWTASAAVLVIFSVVLMERPNGRIKLAAWLTYSAFFFFTICHVDSSFDRIMLVFGEGLNRLRHHWLETIMAASVAAAVVINLPKITASTSVLLGTT